MHLEAAEKQYEHLALINQNKVKANEMNKTIQEKIEMLAEQLLAERNSAPIPDQELNEIFNRRWKEWLQDIPSVPYKNPLEIENAIVQKIRDFFIMQRDQFNETLAKSPFKHWNSNIMIDFSRHLEIKTFHKRFTETEATDFARSKCNSILVEFKKSIHFADVANNFNELLLNFCQQINRIIEDMSKMNSSPDNPVRFTRQLIIDLTLIAGKNSEQVFIESQSKSRKNDPKLKLEEKNAIHRKVFCTMYKRKRENLRIQEENREILQKSLDDLQKEEKRRKEEDKKNEEARKLREKKIREEEEKREAARQRKEKERKEKEEKDEQDREERERKRLKKEEEQFERDLNKQQQKMWKEQNRVRLQEEQRVKRNKEAYQELSEYFYEILKTICEDILRTSMPLVVYNDMRESDDSYKEKSLPMVL